MTNSVLPATSPDLTVSRADFYDDRAAVESVWSQNFSSTGDRRFDCYLTGPDGPGSIWVLRTPAGDVVGTAGLQLRTMQFGNRTATTGVALNLAVAPAYRSAGPAVRLQRALIDEAFQTGLACVVGASENGAAVLKRAGYKPLGPIFRLVKPLRSEYKLKQYLKSPLAARIVARGADAALWATSPETWRGLPPGWAVEHRDDFDERIERLWGQVAHRFPIATVRTQAFMQWRFVACAETPYRVMYLHNPAGELAACAVFQPQGDTVELSDVAYADLAALDLLLAEFLRRVRADRARFNAVTFVGFGADELINRLRAFGFAQRQGRKTFLAAVNPATRQSLPDVNTVSHWYLTAADLDS